MPITGDRFDELDEDIPTFEEGTNAYRVLKFLIQNRDKAFKQGEIAEQTEVKTGSIGVVLSRLHDHDLVEHKGEYWKIAEDDRLGAYEGMLLSMRTSADEGEYDTDEWDRVAAGERE